MESLWSFCYYCLIYLFLNFEVYYCVVGDYEYDGLLFKEVCCVEVRMIVVYNLL